MAKYIIHPQERVNKYNEQASDLVSQCHKDIVEIMKKHEVAKIMFSQHLDILEDGMPFAVFNNDNDEYQRKDLGEVV